MRCVLCTLAVLMLAGCRSQSTTLSNPFLSPDRVPPPATRTLLPGTAQPYYPGDPVPNSPAIGLPPPTFAPQPAQALPPGGWNTTPPPATTYPSVPSGSGFRPTSAETPVGPNVPVNEAPVQVVVDQQNLRFASPPPTSFAAVRPSSSSAPLPSLNQMSGASVLPTPQVAAPPIYAGQRADYQAPIAQPQYVQQTAAAVSVRPVQLRAITSAELPLRGETASVGAARDGFRPQRSAVSRATHRSVSPANPPGFSPTGETAERFGFDPQYGWLRGRLEYSQTNNQWKLRYISVQDATDRFGGSVLIANPHVLSNLRPGDYVMLRGRLQAQETDPHSFAPIYTVSIVQRQQI